jgi:hypothetical protein
LSPVAGRLLPGSVFLLRIDRSPVASRLFPIRRARYRT